MKKFLLLCCLFIGFVAVGLCQTSHSTSIDLRKKAGRLQKQLELTDEQTKKITAIFKESTGKFEKIKKDQHGDTNKMLVAMASLRIETIKKIKALLTPLQTVKFDKLIEQMDSSVSNGRSDGRVPASFN